MLVHQTGFYKITELLRSLSLGNGCVEISVCKHCCDVLDLGVPYLPMYNACPCIIRTLIFYYISGKKRLNMRESEDTNRYF